MSHILGWSVLGVLLLLAPCAVATAMTDADTCAEAASKDFGEDVDTRILCSIPSAYQHDVAVAETLGRSIRHHDMAAWLTTDALLAEGAFSTIPGTGRGWLTEAEGDGQRVRVSYFVENEGTIAAFAESTLYLEPFGARDSRRLRPLRPATPSELARLEARSLATSQDGLRCTDASYNSVILWLDDDGEEQILVFLMPPMENHVLPFGGYHMFRISTDGQRLIDHFAQTRTCLGAAPETVKKAEALPLSHSTSATPTMFHVFMNLQYRKPLLVFTTQNDLLWKVEDGKIGILNSDDPRYPSARSWADDIEIEHEPTPTSSPIG